jgi:excinuclease ABC subunit C
MQKEDLPHKKIPGNPGVYFFLGKRKEVLYIGKATSLKTRVQSYFDSAIGEKRSPLIEQMVQEAKSLEWSETDSVLEAMLLETNLIRTHKPRYNTRAKDDKSYNHVVITDEAFPRLLIVRAKDLADDTAVHTKVYGPFPSGTLFKTALKIIRKLFQFYDASAPVDARVSKLRKGKIDFNRQIGLYPQNVSKTAYARTIRHLMLFFEGKKERIITELERDMHRAAKREAFEEADVLKRKIFALRHIQDVALIGDDARAYRDERQFRIEAYDVAHLSGTDMVGVMAVLEGQTPDTSAYRKFIIRTLADADDPRALKEILTRRLAHADWRYPDLIVVDGSTAQANAVQVVLTAHKLHIPIVGVVKDEHHKPKRLIGPAKIIEEYRTAILFANAEAHRFAIQFHRKKRRKASFGK